jgi:hypothetical protein
MPVNPPNGNNGNCASNFAAAGAVLGGVAGFNLGFDLGATAGAVDGTLVEPWGGTFAGAGIGGAAGGLAGGATGGYLGYRVGAALGSIVCASGSTGGGGGGGSPARQNKINHIFGNPGHNLQILVQKFGSEEAAYDALEAAAQQQVKGTGVFEQIVNVDGVGVTVRGNVINEVVNIGTAFR